MNLYSRKRFLASLLPVLACAGFFLTAAAQKRRTHKLRATAVVEVTTSSKGVVATHVIPVTILDQGQFNDASVYKATPRPMALDNGIVYEAQNSGVPVGYATIINGISKDDTWTALGKWSVAKDEPKKSEASAAVTSSGGDDDRPILHRASGSDSSSSAPASTSSSTDSDRPVLRRPESSATPSPTPAPSGSSSSSSEPSSDDRPTLHRPDNSAAPAATPTPTPSGSSSDASQDTAETSAPSEDPDRPTLKRSGSKSTPSKTSPSQSASQPVKSTATGKEASAKERKPMTVPGTKFYAAVSDTEPVDTRSFVFPWKPDEEEAMRPKMQKLALAELPKDRTQLSSDLQKSDLFRNVVIRSFDLDLSNDAVIVYSAEVPGTIPSTKESAAKFVTRYVTVIARVDFDGNPQKVFASVTDSSRLDVTPRLELIDAVDVDGDGVAELLFRQYGYDDSGFVIYSVGRSSVNKLFEGASAPLRTGN